MPKTSRSIDEVNEIKETILSEAIKLMDQEGFDNMSMRKLAQRMSMTAANIYNYYSNKDELYLAMQTWGFVQMQKSFIVACDNIEDPAERLSIIIRKYLTYGIENFQIYNIIFSMNSPKYMDYSETDLEPVAYREKEAGLMILDFTVNLIEEIKERYEILLDSRFYAVKIWTQLHGVVSLINSRVLQETVEDYDDIVEEIISDIMKKFELG